MCPFCALVYVSNWFKKLKSCLFFLRHVKNLLIPLRAAESWPCLVAVLCQLDPGTAQWISLVLSKPKIDCSSFLSPPHSLFLRKLPFWCYFKKENQPKCLVPFLRGCCMAWIWGSTPEGKRAELDKQHQTALGRVQRGAGEMGNAHLDSDTVFCSISAVELPCLDWSLGPGQDRGVG